MNSLEQLSTISSEQLYFEFKETAALYPNRAASCLEGKINLDGESSELRIQMSNIQDQEDDVDLFVSPRRFGGRTPGPKATKQKVFDEELAKRASQNSERDDIPIEDLKYNFPPVIGKNKFLKNVRIWISTIIYITFIVSNPFAALFPPTCIVTFSKMMMTFITTLGGTIVLVRS